MSRDVGTFAEAKNVQESMESREAGSSSPGPKPSSMEWEKTFKGGKTHPTGKTFTRPGMGTMRKHLEG
jgi:hypothetical protein